MIKPGRISAELSRKRDALLRQNRNIREQLRKLEQWPPLASAWQEIPITVLNLGGRAENGLLSEGLHTIGDRYRVKRQDLRRIRGFGTTADWRLSAKLQELAELNPGELKRLLDAVR